MRVGVHGHDDREQRESEWVAQSQANMPLGFAQSGIKALVGVVEVVLEDASFVADVADSEIGS